MTRGFANGKQDWLTQKLGNPEFRKAFDQERAVREFQDQLQSVLEQGGLTRGHNLTIATMSELASACGFELHIRLRRHAVDAGAIFSEPDWSTWKPPYVGCRLRIASKKWGAGSMKTTSSEFGRARRALPVAQTVRFSGMVYSIRQGPKAEPSDVKGPTTGELDALAESLGPSDKVLRLSALDYLVIRAASEPTPTRKGAAT